MGWICSECIARRTFYNSRKEGRKEGENCKEREKDGRKENEGESEREGTANEREGESEREGTANKRERERERERSTQYALKLTKLSSLELIQESVSCCLLRPLLTTIYIRKRDANCILYMCRYVNKGRKMKR